MCSPIWFALQSDLSCAGKFDYHGICEKTDYQVCYRHLFWASLSSPPPNSLFEDQRVGHKKKNNNSLAVRSRKDWVSVLSTRKKTQYFGSQALKRLDQ